MVKLCVFLEFAGQNPILFWFFKEFINKTQKKKVNSQKEEVTFGESPLTSEKWKMLYKNVVEGCTETLLQVVHK